MRYEFLRRVADLDVYLVDGTTLRNEVDPDFAHGGHRFVFDFIPWGVIWIDRHLPKSEWEATILHEVVEYHLMEEHWTYEEAHETALAEERAFRGSGLRRAEDVL